MTYHQQYYQKNKASILKQQNKYRKRNKDIIKQKRLEKYRKKREAYLLYQKERIYVRDNQ